MIKKILIAVVLVNLVGLNLTAQTVPSPTEISINIEPTSELQIPDEVLDTLMDPMSLLTLNDTLNLSIAMLLADTNTVSKIHIKLGTTLGGNDLLMNVYTYDNLTPGGDLTYFREGEMLTLGMGMYLNLGIFYCEIVLEDSVGNLSEIITSQTDQ